MTIMVFVLILYVQYFSRHLGTDLHTANIKFHIIIYNIHVVGGGLFIKMVKSMNMAIIKHVLEAHVQLFLNPCSR